MKLEQAQTIAEALKAEFEPFCEKIEIGGSIRRKKHEPNDIELVCIPKFGDFPIGQMSLEGNPLTSYENLLFEHIAANRHDKYAIIKMGEKYAQIEVFDEHATGVRQYIKVDIFTATFRTWGYIFMLRTGPAEFSKFVVTTLKQKGYVLKDGAIWSGSEPLLTRNETDVFHLLQIADIYSEYRYREHYATPSKSEMREATETTEVI